MYTLIVLAVAGVLFVVAFAIVLMFGARARMPLGEARAYRVLLAVLGAFFITMIGWVFFVLGVHRQTPMQTTGAFLGVPFVQAIAYFNWSVADTWSNVALISGVAVWAVVLYVGLLIARIPGQRPAAEARERGSEP